MHDRIAARTVLSARARLVGAIALVLSAPALAQTQTGPTLEELARRLQALEQRYGAASTDADGQPLDLQALDRRLRALERNLALQEEARQDRGGEAAVVSVSDKGAALRSGDGDHEIRIRGLLQGDGRFFGGGAGANDTFLLRTARPTLEGTLGRWIGFRFTPEFAGDSASIVDAYADLRFSPAATVRVGKFTSPVGLERLQSSSSLAAVERALASELLPNRDIGVQLQGEAAGGRLSYALGVFNGAVDGRDAATTNPDDEFEYAGRLFLEPLKDSGGFWAGLGFGIGASTGEARGAGNLLPRYRTPGQQTFFAYRAGVEGDGRRRRWSPQAWFHRGPFGLQAEYASSRQEVRLDAAAAEVEATAWQATLSWVLTGEDAGYRGVARPSRPFAPGRGGWGAWELVARYGRLEVDQAAFPVFADPDASARRAAGWTAGVNWYLNSNLKLVVNYLHTGFEGGAAGGADRADEKAVFTRLQVAF